MLHVDWIKVGGLCQMKIESKHQGEKETRNDNVSQTEETQIQFASFWIDFKRIARQKQFNGPIEISGNLDHDFRTKDPENVVKEESNEKNGRHLETADAEIPNAL